VRRSGKKASQRGKARRYRSRGVDVEILEAAKRVELKLDGMPIHVSIIDGKVHCQLAHQFRSFDSIDDVVEMLLTNQGRTWTLHGHVCDERCGEGAHHHDQPHSTGHVHGDHHHGKGGQP
jgi:hypothetical protein